MPAEPSYEPKAAVLVDPCGAYLKRAQVGGELSQSAECFDIEVPSHDQRLAVRTNGRKRYAGIEWEAPSATGALG
jgi:hypothetical protein